MWVMQLLNQNLQCLQCGCSTNFANMHGESQSLTMPNSLESPEGSKLG